MSCFCSHTQTRVYVNAYPNPLIESSLFGPIFLAALSVGLVNGHPTRYLAVREVGHLHHVRFLVLALHLSIGDVGFESSSEIQGAHNSIDNCDDDKDNGDNGEGRE